jgi:hypothetical protein
VCISRETYERVRGQFSVKDVDGRLAKLKGFGEVRVWDVGPGECTPNTKR